MFLGCERHLTSSNPWKGSMLLEGYLTAVGRGVG